ncbi:MAG: cytochrome c [Alphaproteobacteria bacterium]|nr:cytochrome c [Alphaproteobacteria bacterium]
MAGLIGAAALAVVIVMPTQAVSVPQPVSFQKQVLPIFQEHCVACHSPGGAGYISVDMDLRSYKALRSGSAGGIAVIPFHPRSSPLMRVLDDDWSSSNINSLRMPPMGPKLSPDDLKTISEWIKQGAKDN